MKNRSVECAWEEDPFSKGRRGLREQMACGEWRWQRPLPCSYAVIASRRRARPNACLLLRAAAHSDVTAPIRAWQVLRGPGRASAQPLPPQRGRARLRRAARAVAACVDTYVPELPYCTYGLRVPITPSCCTYPGRRAACPGTAAVRNAYRGTPGGTRACGRPCSAGRSGPSWRASRARAALSTCASTTAEPRRGCACRPSATARRRRHRCSSSSSSTCSGGPNP